MVSLFDIYTLLSTFKDSSLKSDVINGRGL